MRIGQDVMEYLRLRLPHQFSQLGAPFWSLEPLCHSQPHLRKCRRRDGAGDEAMPEPETPMNPDVQVQWPCSAASSLSSWTTSSSPLSTDEYKPVPAKQWEGIYPPVLPPADFFDLAEEAKDLKDMFKKNNDDGPLYDETGKVDLPTDEKDILILDPVSRTRLLDTMFENYIFSEYCDWIYSALMDATACNGKQRGSWLEGLYKVVFEDNASASVKFSLVVDEERKREDSQIGKPAMLGIDKVAHVPKKLKSAMIIEVTAAQKRLHQRQHPTSPHRWPKYQYKTSMLSPPHRLF